MKKLAPTRVHFIHVPRIQNAWADYLGRLADKHQADGFVERKLIEDRADGVPGTMILTAYTGHGDLTEKCRKCNMFCAPDIQCHGCGHLWHKSCVEGELPH